MEVARQNESHFENTKHLVIELMDFQIRKGSIEELLDIFELRFPSTLAANEYRLVLLDTEMKKHLTKVLCLSSQELEKNASRFYEMEKSFCGNLSKEEKNLFFGQQAELVASSAVIPLRYKHMSGLVVVGNFKDGHFYKGMGTMFLDHIGDTLARVLNELLFQQERKAIAI